MLMFLPSTLWSLILLIVLPQHSSTPPDSFSDLDTDALVKLWPTFYWTTYLYAQFLGFVTTYERSGYLTHFGRFRAAFSWFVLWRLPIVLVGLVVSVVVASSSEAELGDTYPLFFMMLFNTFGLPVYCIFMGAGVAQLPPATWIGTYRQQQSFLKRKVIKTQNAVTFCNKQYRSAELAAEDARDAMPLSEPSYALFVGILKNPMDPFAAPIDEDEDLDEEDMQGHTLADRKEELLGRLKGHAALAAARERLMHAKCELMVAEQQAAVADRRLDDIQHIGRTGCSVVGVLAGILCSIFLLFSALVVWWQFMCVIAPWQGLPKELSVIPGIREAYEDDTPDIGAYLYTMLQCYMFFCLLFAIVSHRRWFAIYSLGLAYNSIPSSILRFVEVILYLVHPFMMNFVTVVSRWHYADQTEPPTAYERLYEDIEVFPVVGGTWVVIMPLLVTVVFCATFFFDFPQRALNIYNRWLLKRMADEEEELVRAAQEEGPRYLRKNKIDDGFIGLFTSSPHLTDFAIFGVPMEGSELLAAGELIGSYDPQNCEYQWSRRQDFNQDWEPILGATRERYTPRRDDIDYQLQCTCIPRTATGQEGVPAEAVTTEKIRIALPRMKSLRIEGGPYHTATYKTKGEYVGGVEGDSIIQWFKVKGGVTKTIPNANDIHYVPSIDDVAYVLKVEYTPMRVDGVKGPTVTAESNPLKIDPSIGKTVKNHIVGSNAEFEVYYADRGQEVKREIIVTDRQLRVREKKSWKVKEDLGPHIRVDIEPGDQYKFKVVIGERLSIPFKAKSHKERDIIALTIRSFCVMSSDKTTKGKGKGR
eukprot:TRINITY_DN1108_c0_g1_i1.p1 TRINITY_DN1108_c0_g1~~TRINITY_DN1108_c0_g1_i1.p1  ORF type:complete len:815 (-),score=218.76 TRINITY_DN1108_c0_g1_i1:82-2526(-)